MSAPGIEPRYFWRRLFALMVDGMIASLIGALLVLPLTKAYPTKVQLSEGFIQVGSRCFEITSLPPEIVAYIDGRDVVEAKFCKVRPFGVFPEQNRVTIEIADPVPEGSRIKRQVVLDLMADDEGRIISPLHINEVVGTFVLLLGSAASVARGGATPGKRLLKLRVQGGGCALCREARRLGPLLVLSLAELLVIVGGLQIAGPLAIGLAAVLVLGLVAYYVWPLLRWRGAMPYDRATGFRVTRG